jgi:translation initiation factor 2D
LKGKDRDNFETVLKKQFDALTVRKIFEDSEECMQEKLVGSKMIIYHTDEYPAFIDGTGKEDYVPSCIVYLYTSIRCFRISSFNWYSNPQRS